MKLISNWTVRMALDPSTQKTKMQLVELFGRRYLAANADALYRNIKGESDPLPSERRKELKAYDKKWVRIAEGFLELAKETRKWGDVELEREIEEHGRRFVELFGKYGNERRLLLKGPLVTPRNPATMVYGALRIHYQQYRKNGGSEKNVISFSINTLKRYWEIRGHAPLNKDEIGTLEEGLLTAQKHYPRTSKSPRRK